MTFVDTGFFLALAQPTDALHQRAAAWAKHVTGRLVLTEYVLWETVNGLSRRADRPRVAILLKSIQGSDTYEVIPATTELLEASLQLHAQRPDKDWSLTDCASFIVMQRRGITRALTPDHHFEQAGFEALMRGDPP